MFIVYFVLKISYLLYSINNLARKLLSSHVHTKIRSCKVCSQTFYNVDLFCILADLWKTGEGWNLGNDSSVLASAPFSGFPSRERKRWINFTHYNPTFLFINCVHISTILIRYKHELFVSSCTFLFNLTHICRKSSFTHRNQTTEKTTLRQSRLSFHIYRAVIAACFDSFQANCWLSLPTTSTTDTTSVWRTWCTTWPQRTGPKPKTSSTRGSSPSYSPSPAWSPSPCSAPSARCQNRPTTWASCTPLRSTKATVPLTPCTSRVHRDTSPGTARRAARASRTRQCLCLRTRSSTVDTCHRCRDSITTISTSSATHTPTRLVCTVRNTPCK